MKKLLIITTFIFLFFPSWALCETAESKSSPPTLQQIAPDSWYYNYNIQEVQKEGETFYRYNHVLITGTPTRQKVLDAIKASESTKDTAAIEEIATNRTTALDQLAEIAAMTYIEIDTYVENTFGNLSAAQKTALKKLYKVVLAMLKQMDLNN